MLHRRLFLPLVVLVIAALACGGTSGGGGDGGPTRTPRPRVLFEDDFEDQSNGWGTGDEDVYTLDYRDGAYVFDIRDTEWFIWGVPEADDMSNVHIAVTIRNAGGSSDTGFGVMCNFASGDAHYYLGVSADGYYAIVRVDGADDETFLTSDENQWLSSDDIAQNADEYRLEADCGGDGTLRLAVDGTELAEVSDDTYSSGNVGLFVWTFDDVPVEIHFDDLVVTEIPD